MQNQKELSFFNDIFPSPLISIHIYMTFDLQFPITQHDQTLVNMTTHLEPYASHNRFIKTIFKEYQHFSDWEISENLCWAPLCLPKNKRNCSNLIRFYFKGWISLNC